MTADLHVKPKRAAQLVADHLRAEIVLGNLATGETLPVERELIETYGVSRPTLREALRISHQMVAPGPQVAERLSGLDPIGVPFVAGHELGPVTV